MNSEDSTKVPGKTWMVMIALFVISILYDALVIRRMDRKHLMERWTWLTVVIGVAYTLVGIAMLDRRAAMLAFVAFCFSGTPMSVGDLVRYLERRIEGERVLSAVNGRARRT